MQLVHDKVDKLLSGTMKLCPAEWDLDKKTSKSLKTL